MLDLYRNRFITIYKEDKLIKNVQGLTQIQGSPIEAISMSVVLDMKK